MKFRIISGLLTVSLLANLALVGYIKSSKSRPAEQQAVLPAPTLAETAPPPFRWSQVESADYPTYIANLRAIGCPELTIRELITADVCDLYAPRRAPWLAKLGHGNVSPSGRQEAEDALHQLDLEQSAIIRRLFGIPDPVEPAAAVAAAATPAHRPREVIEDTNAVMPLVFQNVNTNALQMSGQAMEIMDQVRNKFVAQLGTNYDVNSPEYLTNWQKAQKQADLHLTGMLGRRFTLKYQEEAHREAAANSQGN